MPRIGEISLLHAGVGAACLPCAMLVVVLAHGVIHGMAAAQHARLPVSTEASLPPASTSVHPVTGGAARFPSGSIPGLDRIAAAIDAAESNYGTNPRMMRAALEGPQGPMQLTAAAAADIGGGDRFNMGKNFALGRAYLAHMYRRYGSWVDAVAAYNWGPGHMDAWIHEGRRADRLPASVARYTGQVLLASVSPGVQLPDPDVKAPRFTRHPPGPSLRVPVTPVREGAAGSDGPSIPAGAGRIGKTMLPVLRSHPRQHRGPANDHIVRSHALSLRLPRTQAHDLFHTKASGSNRHDSSPKTRGTLHYRAAHNEGPRFILSHSQRARETQSRQLAKVRRLPARKLRQAKRQRGGARDGR